MINFPPIRSIQDFSTFIEALILKIYYKYLGKMLSENALKKGVITYKSPFGFKVNLNLNRVVDRDFYIGSFERETFNFFRKALKPNMVLLDIGGNIGLFSLTASAVTDGKIDIYAFEPADEVNVCFNENIKLNNFKNIKLFKKGIADKTGELVFNICEDNAYNSLNANPMKEVVKKVVIQTTTIDEFCVQENIKRIDLIKIDTEGAEFMVLLGSSRTLANANAPMLFLEYNQYILDEEHRKAIRDLLISFGYQLYELRFGILKKFNHLKSNANDLICLKPNHLEYYF